MKCPNCGKEFTNDVKFCDNCGTSLNTQNVPLQPAPPPAPQYVQQPQQPIQQQGTYYTPPGTTPVPPKKKKSGCLIAIIAVVVVAVIIFIVAIASSGGDDKKVPVTDSSGMTESVKNDNKTTEPKSTYGINESATYRNAEITVTNVKRSAGGEWDKPKAGMEYIIVTVQIRNVGDSDNLSYNSWDFKMKNSQGQILDDTYTSVDSDTALSYGDLVPGGQVTGTIAFEQPKGDNGLELQYTGNLWLSDARLTFTLQ